MSDTDIVPAAAAPVVVRSNAYWWIVAIVGIVAVAIIAGLCIARGRSFSGHFQVGQKSWYGTKVAVACN